MQDVSWKNETEFATCGAKHVKFFSLQGANLNGKKGIYGKLGITPIYVIKFLFKGSVCLSGSAKGQLLVWGGTNIGKAIPAHKSALVTINELKNGIITGGNDGVLITWDKMYKQLKKVDMSGFSQFPTGVRSLDLNPAQTIALVGTKSSEIMEVDINGGKKMSTLIHGHFEGKPKAELWGCAVHPSKDEFATCGADGTVRIWSTN